MSAREDYHRIVASKTPYETLNVPTDATSEEIRSAYKKLSLKFHPDRISLPDVRKDSVQEAMVEEFRKKAYTCFEAVSEAADILLDPRKRADLDCRQGGKANALDLTPYQAPPHQMQPPHQGAPPRRSHTYAGGHGGYEDIGDPYGAAETFSQQRPRSRMYTAPQRRSSVSSSFDSPAGRPDPQKMFNDLMGVSSGGGDPFDIFGAMAHPVSNAFASKDPFEAFFGQDMFRGQGQDDPVFNAFNNMSLAARPTQQGSGQRGAFASHRVTRRHTSRTGDVTTSRHERTLAMMDHGDRGKVLVESSFKIMGFQPGQGSSALTPGAAGDPFAGTDFSQDLQNRALGQYGAPSPAARAASAMSAYAPPNGPAMTSNARQLSDVGRNAVVPTSQALMRYPQMDESRMIGAAPHISKDPSLYDRGDFGRAGALVPRPYPSALVGSSSGFPY